jgi:hypothetical protein
MGILLGEEKRTNFKARLCYMSSGGGGKDSEDGPVTLITWDLSAQMRDRLGQNGIDGQFIIEKLDDGSHSRLVLSPQDSTLTKSWIFSGGKIISSILYHKSDWNIIDSEHFKFFISDSSLFHPANIDALESFLTELAHLLGLSESDIERLSKEKIYYCFCRNEGEIRELTGYAAHGIYIYHMILSYRPIAPISMNSLTF